jgi:tetratricopeptide (TPR) repeat protein
MEARGERSVSAGRDIGVAITGDHNQVVLGSMAPMARSAYQEQVRRLAPRELLDRDDELADLAAFCTADSGPAYAWWRAGAWAGKTALMSWFALHPPPGVRVVPFFVTARLGAHDDAVAYVDIVGEQLAELAGEGLPAHLTVATREAHLLRLYGAAARTCAARGERLVLLVDGLDEDRGVTTGPDAHSIAGLLPERPEAGLRVLVAGRLHPPLPPDVVERHPLRDPAAVRELAVSAHAQAIRAEAERELKRLLRGPGLAHDLLVFVTAAEGSLTTADLARLTGATPYEVTDLLRTMVGRTFATRADGYLLAHEELRVQAEEMIGARELTRRRESLQEWADTYAARGWPEDTPGYLLRGHFLVLRRCGDLDRMLRYALDAVRHDRMFAVTGGDATALREIRLVWERVTGAGRPVDLLTLLRLAMRRTDLLERNSWITAEFALAWAELGEYDRAEAMARTHRHPEDRAECLARVAGTLAIGGRHERARILLDEVEAELAEAMAEVAGSAAAPDGHRQTYGLPAARTAVVQLLLALDLYDRAEQVASSGGDTWPEHRRIACLTGVRIGAGQIDRALELLESQPDVDPAYLVRIGTLLSDYEPLDSRQEDRLRALVTDGWQRAESYEQVRDVVEVLARAGEFDAAERAARTWDTDAEGRAGLLLTVYAELVRADYPESGRLFSEIAASSHRDEALVASVTGLSRIGLLRQAREHAQLITEPYDRENALTAVVEALAARGKFTEAETLQRTCLRDDQGDEALVRGTVAWAARGHREEAVGYLVRLQSRLRDRAADMLAVQQRIDVADALREVGRVDDACRLLDGIEDALPRRPDPSAQYALSDERDWLVGDVVRVLAEAGEWERAAALLSEFSDRDRVTGTWRDIVGSLVHAGAHDQASALERELDEEVAACLSEDADWLREEIVRDLVDAGRPGEATAYAERAGTESFSAETHSALAAALALRGRFAQARAALEAARTASRAHRSSAVRYRFLALRALGDHDGARRAIEDAVSIGVEEKWLGGVDDLMRTLVTAGEPDWAESVARDIDTRRQAHDATDALVKVLVAVGDHERAIRLSGLGTDPTAISGATAVALVPAVDPDLGRELAAYALGEYGSWVYALPALAHVDPRTVPLAIDFLDHRTRAGPPPTEARTSAPSSK